MNSDWQDITTNGTSSSYTPVAADLGHQLLVVATGNGYYTDSVTSTATNAVTQQLTDTTTSTNSAQVGQTVTTTLAPSDATANYQWYRGDTAITGAISSSYTVTTNDIGYTLKVVATGTGDYTGTKESSATNVVSNPPQVTPAQAPRYLSAVQLNNDTLIISWSVPVDVQNVAGYIIEVKNPAGTVVRTINDVPLRNATNGTFETSHKLHPINFVTGGAGVYTVSIIARGVDGVQNSPAATTTVAVAIVAIEDRPKADGTFQAKAVATNNVATGITGQNGTNTVVIELNRHNSRAVQNVSYYIITSTSHPALGTFVVAATGGKQDWILSGLQAGTTYKFNIIVVGENGNNLRDSGTNVTAKTSRPAGATYKAPAGIKVVGGLNSVTLTGLTVGKTYSVDVWQTNGRTHAQANEEMRSRGEFRGYFKTVEFIATATSHVIDGLNRNSQSTKTTDGKENRTGLRYQFRISEQVNATEWTTARNVNAATVNLNASGLFAAVKGTGYVANGNILRFNISPVAEVTHYEIGIRQGAESVGFVTGDTGTTIFTTESLLALIEGRSGYSIVGDKIRIAASALEPNAAGRVEIAGLLPPGLRCTLAIRAVVVDAAGVVERESANANRSVNVR